MIFNYIEFLLFGVLSLIGEKALSSATEEETGTCGLTKKDGINTFTLRSSSLKGDIPLIHIQFDTTRKLPVTSTVVYDEMNLIQNVDRSDNFREIDCGQLQTKQQNCADTMRLSKQQKEKVDAEYNSWDRGHLTPVNPMRFSGDAVNATYYCVNIAPQEPWSNRCPWYAVEERTLSRTHTFPSFVITGVCSSDNSIDGNTYYNLTVPECFWKMSCYVDPQTKKTQVVAFIGDNSLISSSTKEIDRKKRQEETIMPRSQQDVINIMGSKSKFISSAWRAAERILTEGRDSAIWPKATTCTRTKDLSEEVAADWQTFMKRHRPPLGCKKY